MRLATHRYYDNCTYGKSIDLTAKKSNGTSYTKTMKKRDNGALPDAVIDIWKTGVEYWGYTWHSSFSMPGTVKYVHSR